MAEKTSNSNIVSNMFWKFAERVAAQLVTFVVSIILARLLAPADYGEIAIVMLLITFANVFVSAGFGNALIQKKNSDNLDFSSVFFVSLAVSVLFYLLLFIGAPQIAGFFKDEMLTLILRVMGLRLIFAAVNSVQEAYVAKKMIFKKFFLSTLIGTLASVVIGVALAYKGAGVWALVAQDLCNTIIGTLVLWNTVKWRPQMVFSLKRVKALFSYGYKLLLADLLSVFSENFRQLIIGKVYSAADLGLYSRGIGFPSLIMSSINTSMNAVLFPAMAEAQDDIVRLKEMARRYIRIASYILFPVLVGFAVVAKPMVIILLTEKWVGCVPFIAIGCFSHAVTIMQYGVQNVIKAIGRSDVFLAMDVTVKALGIVLVVFAMRYGVMAIAMTAFVTGSFSFLMKMVVSKHLFGYQYKEHFFDNAPIALAAVTMGVIVYSVQLLEFSNAITLSVQIPLGIFLYLLFSILFKFEGFNFVIAYAKVYNEKRVKVKKNA